MTPEERKRDWQKRQRQQDWARRQAAQQQQPPAQDPTGFLEDLGIGVERGYRKYIVPAASSIAEVTEGMKQGDFGPAWQMAKEAGRGVYNALTIPDPQVTRDPATGRAVGATLRPPDPVLQEAQARRDARFQASPEGQRARQRLEELDRRAALDPSITGKITRGAGEVLTAAAPTIAAGVASGGSVPIMALAAAAQSANQPSMMGANAATGMLPIPAGKFVAPLLRRIRAGRSAGASQAAEPVESIIRAELGAEQQAAMRAPATAASMESLPVRESMSRPPLLEAAEPDPFGVSLASERPRLPGASGPRIDEYGFVEGAGSATGKAVDPSLVAKAERTKVLEVISAARKAGLLTSAKTHIKNIAGTGGFQLGEEISRIPGAVVDMLVSRVTGRRTVTGPSTDSMLRSFQEAGTKGWQEAKEVWRKGVTQADVERLGLNAEINSGNKLLDAYINKTFRSLSVEDKLLNTYATRRALEERVRAAVLTEIRQGKITKSDYGKRWKELMDNAPADIQAGAIVDGEVAVFTNENVISKFLAGGRREVEKLPGGRGAMFALDLIFPFVKTPTNVIARMLDYAGLGAMKETVKAVRPLINKSMTAEQQRQFALQWGRAGIGGGLVTLGVIGYRNGWLTGFVEDDLNRRERDEVAGRLPGAVKVGGRWHQILGAAPLASLLVLGATMAREVDQEREESSGLLPVLETLGQAVSEQPLLIGSRQVAESLTKPGTTGERLAGGLIGSFVPTFASDLGEAFDPRQREAAGITGQARKRIPFLRQTLPEATDALGQPRQDFNAFQAIGDPTRATTDVTQQNPVLGELVRLDAGLSGIKRKADESAQDFRLRTRQFGQMFLQYGGAIVSDPQYQRADDRAKRNALANLSKLIKRELGDDDGDGVQPGRLGASSIFEGLRRSDERRRERERKQGRR